jgi:drug/metabolite transporter (DMT)-like permease
MALLALSGAIGIALGDTFFFQALKDLGPALVVILIMLGQVLTAALGIVFLREGLTWMKGMGILLVIAGVGVVMSTKLTGERQPSHVRGIIFGLLSVVCMAIAGLITKVALKDDSDTVLATFIRMLAGTLLMLVVGLGTRQMGRWVSPFQDRALAGRFVLATAVVTFGGFWLTTVAFKYAELSVANTLSSVEPLFVLPLAAIFCNERVTWSAIFGTAVAVAGIVLLVSFQPVGAQ